MSYNFMYGIPNLLFNMKLLFNNFRGNALGGLTAGIVALPLALAFGVSSGLGPSAGLYALEDVIIDLERQGIEVLLVGLQEQPKYLMKVIGMIGELIEEEHLFENFSTARLWINQQNVGK